jgi:hypothetical protein
MRKGWWRLEATSATEVGLCFSIGNAFNPSNLAVTDCKKKRKTKYHNKHLPWSKNTVVSKQAPLSITHCLFPLQFLRQTDNMHNIPETRLRPSQNPLRRIGAMTHKTKYNDHGTLQTSNEEVLLISAATRKILNGTKHSHVFSPLKNTPKL